MKILARARLPATARLLCARLSPCFIVPCFRVAATAILSLLPLFVRAAKRFLRREKREQGTNGMPLVGSEYLTSAVTIKTAER